LYWTFPAERVAVITTVFNNLCYQEKLVSELSNPDVNDALVAPISQIWPYTEPFKWWRALSAAPMPITSSAL